MKLRKFEVHAAGENCGGIFDNDFEFKAHSIREAVEYAENRQRRHDRKALKLVEQCLLSQDDFDNAPCYSIHLFERVGEDLADVSNTCLTSYEADL